MGEYKEAMGEHTVGKLQLWTGRGRLVEQQKADGQAGTNLRDREESLPITWQNFLSPALLLSLPQCPCPSQVHII